ncbi:hypothetical protein [Pannonibacter phragmitetus]|nr:hypothetical protein [Pannonibacter phragmitetus]
MKPIFVSAAICAMTFAAAATTPAFADRLTLDCRAKPGNLFDPYGRGRHQLILDFDSRTVIHSTGLTGEIFAVDSTKISLGKDGYPYVNRITGEYHHSGGSMNCHVVPTKGF